MKKQHLELLKTEHTKVLLAWLGRARRCGGSYSPYAGSSGDNVPFFSIEEIKEVLKTREHVPNKIEAKKVRQNKAKGLR